MTALLLCAFCASQAQTLLDSLPAAELPLLTDRHRQELDRRWQEGARPATLDNLMGGRIHADSLSADYAALRPTGVNRIEARRFWQRRPRPDAHDGLTPAADTVGYTVVIATTTVPAPDSRLAVYPPSPSAGRYDAKQFFAAPTIADFYVKNDSLSEQVFVAYALVDAMHYRFGGDTLWASYDPQPYLPDEDYRRIAPALRREPRAYVWDAQAAFFVSLDTPSRPAAASPLKTLISSTPQ